jgi:threonine dehydrogenase-like Zn-dependent dehydrogenase
MKGLVNRGPGAFALEELPDPVPGPGELLLRPLVAGLCMTDKHVYDGLMFGPAWRVGLVIGHEFDAVVVDGGDDVEGWQPGDRVCVDPRVFCDECLSCRGGLPSLCERGVQWQGVGDGRDGGLAELCVAPAAGCHRLPDGIGDEAGALVEPLACATRAVRLSGLTVDDGVVLLGAEDYGLLALQRLRGAGAGTIVAVDPSRVRREAALALGATAVADPGDGPAHRTVRDFLPRGADVVFVCMEDYVPAAADYLRLAFRFTRVQGTVVVLRTYGSAPYARIEPQAPYMKELTIRHSGAFYGDEPVRGGRPHGDCQRSIDALADRRVKPLPGSDVVELGALSDPAVVRSLFASYPDACTKTLVRVSD